MESKFQTSFIPKKPFVPVGSSQASPKHHGTSLLMTLAGFLFIASLAGAGGVYGYKTYLGSQQENYKIDLAAREQKFDIDTIESLKRSSIRIDTASKILTNHLAISQVFDVISRLTIAKVRFLSLDVQAPTAQQSNEIKITLKGYGTNLSAVAFQSDVLGSLEQYGLRKVVKNPILSDPSVEADGKVSFGFSATIDPSTLLYSRAVQGLPVTDAVASSTTP